MEPIIQVQHLQKSFGPIKAVQDISFAVQQGELFAFLGVNGAGKSTTISILCSQLKKDSGQVLIGGKPVGSDEVKQRLGVVFQNSVLDSALTVKENLASRAALYGITGDDFNRRISELSELLQLEELLPRTVGKLSGGQRRRIDIARALLHRPDILVLDEPTTGLDPQTRKTLWSVVSYLQKEERLTVFLTTHYMEEAAEADHIVILDSGKIVAEGTPLELKNRYTGDFITLYHVSEEQVQALGCPYTALADGFRLEVPSTAHATQMILQNTALFSDYEITKGKMDDVFLAVTGKKLTGGVES